MTTTNYLSPIDFTFQMSKAPELQYTVQRATLPGITLNISEVPTPFVSIPISGGIEFSEFSITFLVAEDMSNYLEIVNWMFELGRPESFEQYGGETNEDCTITIMNSSSKPVIDAKFYNITPTSITALDLDTTAQDVQYVPATVTFKCLRYEFVPL
jgi:hypothetical protein